MGRMLFETCREILLSGRQSLLPCGESSRKKGKRRLLSAIKGGLRSTLPYEEIGFQIRPLLDCVSERLPAIRLTLQQDIDALLKIDPAATNPCLVALTYPGIEALLAYRIAHMLHRGGAPILARGVSEYAHRETGIDIHPGAEIGAGCAIDHGTGIVIGETAVVEAGVTIYHGVTLGAKSPIGADPKGKRHPTIKRGAVLFAGATILGGETVIGEGVTVKCGALITHSIEKAP